MSIIETRDLTKYYGQVKGIEGINLSIEEQEIFGFIGPNGAGKSTTIRLLMGLIFPTAGSMSIFGKDVLKHGPELRQTIGYLPSEIFYYEKMKVKDLLAYSASFYKKDCKKRMLDLADRMSLDMNRRIEDLSYGNKKKVGIVQGLLHEPKLIVLDEPTSGLDPLMQQTFFDIIREEHQKGATVFFSSHILSEVQAMCNRVAIVKDGGIVKIEDMGQMSQNAYKKIIVRTPEAKTNILSLEGVSQVMNKGQTLEFLFQGDIQKIVHHLSQMTLNDLWIEEPSLEEIFMHYYV